MREPFGCEPTWSRRHFIGAALAASVSAACQRLPVDRAQFPRPKRSAVGLFPAARYDVDLEDVIWRGLRELGVPIDGRRVLLKPNMVEFDPDSVINTSPLVVAAAAAALKRLGAREVVVAEGPGHRRDIEYVLAGSGLLGLLREHRVRFVDLNHDDVEWVPLRSRFMGLERLALPVTLLRSDLVVSMPKLKTHHWVGLTCSMKNLFGVVPGAVYGWPKNLLHFRGIHEAILDLATTVRPGLAIVDGVVGMEGDGPIMGRPRAVGMIAIGEDPVAVDATCARIMGLVPERVPYLATAGDFLGHIGVEEIEQRGERVDGLATAFDVLDVFESIRAASG